MDSAVSTEMSEAEQALRLRLQEEEVKLSGLESDLRAEESAWETLATKRAQFDSMEQVCQTIEKLSEEGVSRSFWGDLASDEEVAAHLDEVRANINELGSELANVEQRRSAARQSLERQVDVVAQVEDDLLAVFEQQVRKQQEWLIEREETELPWHLQIMPWTRGLEDDQLFRKSLLRSALVCLLLGLLIPFIDIPIPDREEVIKVPERLASLIRKERPLPAVQPKPQKRVEKKPREVEPTPELKPEVAPKPQVAEKAAPPAEPESARERVASTGLLAFREKFSNLASSRPSARLGAEASISNSGKAATGLPQRSMVSIQGPGSSGGINLSDLSRDVGDGVGAGDRIDGVALSRVASSIGAGGSSDRPYSAGALAGRTDEEIQIVFDRYKSALYRLYNRELRKDPTLRGQMVLQLTIEADGSVSVCQLQSSDMEAPTLAAQVVQRVLSFDFGAKEVPAITIHYPIDFLPTA